MYENTSYEFRISCAKKALDSFLETKEEKNLEDAILIIETMIE